MSSITLNSAFLAQSTQNPIRRTGADTSAFTAAVQRAGDNAARAQSRAQLQTASSGTGQQGASGGGQTALRTLNSGADTRRPLSPGSLVNILV
jgi:hypothetical protein